jgi:hypothetical protein
VGRDFERIGGGNDVEQRGPVVGEDGPGGVQQITWFGDVAGEEAGARGDGGVVDVIVIGFEGGSPATIISRRTMPDRGRSGVRPARGPRRAHRCSRPRRRS